MIAIITKIEIDTFCNLQKYNLHQFKFTEIELEEKIKFNKKQFEIEIKGLYYITYMM